MFPSFSPVKHRLTGLNYLSAGDKLLFHHVGPAMKTMRTCFAKADLLVRSCKRTVLETDGRG
jgi:hypothetical protein